MKDDSEDIFKTNIKSYYKNDPEFAESINMPVVSYKPDHKYRGMITKDNATLPIISNMVVCLVVNSNIPCKIYKIDIPNMAIFCIFSFKTLPKLTFFNFWILLLLLYSADGFIFYFQSL